MKEKKISFKHFENKKLNEVQLGSFSIRPLYIRINYNRRNIEIRSGCFDYAIDCKFQKKETLIRNVIDIDSRSIEAALEEVRKEGVFDHKKFKSYYLKYSANILDQYEELIRKKAIDFLDKNSFFSLRDALEEKRISVDEVKRTFDTFHYRYLDIQNINNKDERRVLRRGSILEQFSDYIGNADILLSKVMMSIKIHYRERIQKTSNPINNYISLADWHKLSDYIVKHIDDIVIDKLYYIQPTDWNEYQAKLRSACTSFVNELDDIIK